MAALADALHLKIGVLARLGRVGDVFIGQTKLGKTPGVRRVAEPQGYIDALQGVVIRLAANACYMRPLFQPFAEDDWDRRIGATRDDMRAFVGVARVTHGNDFQAIVLADLLGVGFAIGFGRAVDLNPS